MSSSVPNVACRKQLRNCDSSKKDIQGGDDDEERVKKMRNGDGKNVYTAHVFHEKEEKKRLNNKSREKKMRTDGYKEGEKKNGKASASFSQKAKVNERLKVSYSKKNVQTEDGVKEEEDIWNDHSKSKSRKVSTVPYEREERRKRPNTGNCVKKIHSNGDEEEETYMWNCDSRVKDEEVTAISSEKDKKKRRPTNTNGGTNWLQMQSDVEEKRTRNLDCKMRNGESSATFFEKGKEKKRLNSINSEKKVQRDDKKYEKNFKNGHYKVTSRKLSTTPYAKEEKIRTHDNVEKKINGTDRNTSLLFSKNRMQSNDRKKRTDPITSVVSEKKMRPYEITEMQMQHDVKRKKRNVLPDMSKEKKMKASIDHNYERRKREESNTLFKKVKRIQSEDNYKKIHSGKVKEKERNTPSSFFKIICNNFKEFLSLPPRVAPELEDLTNHHVYLQDSEGKCSKIRLSVVDGSLAFHQGWNIFVSDHLIKWGEFLLFEYAAKSTFSVRIFGRDSRERLHFDVGRKREGAKKKSVRKREGIRSHDDLVLFDVKSEDSEDGCSREYPRNKEPETLHVTVHTAEDPKRVEGMVGSGPVPLDNSNGDEVFGQSRTQGTSPLHSKEKGIILITDSGSSIHENDIVKIITSTADSDTHHVSAHMNEDPKKVQNGNGNGQTSVVGVEKERLTVVDYGTKCASLTCSVEKAANAVQSGIGNGPSAVVEDENGILPDVECGTKCTSPKCNKKEALSVDAAPLVHGNYDTSKEYLNLLDSNEDLRRKQEISSINLQCTTAVKKCNSDGKMNVSPDVCRNYEAPGGFRCLEKWRNRIMRHQTVLDGTGLIKPESTREADSEFVVEYGASGLNSGSGNQQMYTMPIKDSARPDRVFMCEHDGTESYHSIDEKGLSPVRSQGTRAFVELQPTSIKNPSSPERISKYGDSMTEISNDIIDGKGTIAKLETKMGHLEPMGSIVGAETTNIPVCANNTDACQSEHCIFKQEDTNSVDFSTPAKPEILESDDPSVLKVNLQFCIPNTTQKWLELPKSLSNAVRQRKQDRNIILLKDPMMRLWPVLYHENSIFVGFTTGWKHFAAANNLQVGDVCELSQERSDEEPVYSVQVTKK